MEDVQRNRKGDTARSDRGPAPAGVVESSPNGIRRAFVPLVSPAAAGPSPGSSRRRPVREASYCVAGSGSLPDRRTPERAARQLAPAVGIVDAGTLASGMAIDNMN